LDHNEEVEHFLVEFSKNNKLKKCIKCCVDTNKSSLNYECKVLSMALMGVLKEIEDYLVLYDEIAEKGYGSNTLLELKKIQENIFPDFLKIIEDENIKTTIDRIKAVSVFVDGWLNFEKDPIVWEG
jgi:hypothetical protein